MCRILLSILALTIAFTSCKKEDAYKCTVVRKGNKTGKGFTQIVYKEQIEGYRYSYESKGDTVNCTTISAREANRYIKDNTINSK